MNDKVKNLITDLAKGRLHLGHYPADVNTMLMMYLNEDDYLKASSIDYTTSGLGFVYLDKFKEKFIQKMGLMRWNKLIMSARLDAGKKK